MAQGKYSPVLPTSHQPPEFFQFNAYGKEPAPWSKESYDEKTMLGHYDSEGFDMYGYSAWHADGTYAGIGAGVDRQGKTEMDYLCMTEEEFESWR